MGKRKLLVVSLLALAVVAALAVGAYFYLSRDKKSDSSKDAVPAQTKAETKAVASSIENYESITTLFNAKKYKETIAAAKTYGKETTSNDMNRLSVYGYCIMAAKETKEDASKKTCYDEAIVVANGLKDAKEKETWLALVNDAYNGTSTAKVQDATGPQ